MAERERFTRLHAHLPEINRALGGEHVLDEVKVAHRDAARGEKQINALLQPGPNLLRQLWRPVAGDAQQNGYPPVLDDLCRVRVTVGIADLARRQGGVNLDHLVTGSQDRHTGAAHHQHILAPQCSQHPDLLRADKSSPPQDQLPLPHILSGGANVLAPRRLRKDGHPLPLGLRVLDADDPVGPRRYRRTGRDADGRAGRHFLLGNVARRHAPDNEQADGGLTADAGGVGRLHCVTVHRRIGIRRDVHIGAHVLGQDAVQRFEDGHPLWFQRVEFAQYPFQRFFDAQHWLCHNQSLT